MHLLSLLATLAREMANTLGDPWAGLLTEIGQTIEEFGAELDGNTASTPTPTPTAPGATATAFVQTDSGKSPFRQD